MDRPWNTGSLCPGALVPASNPTTNQAPFLATGVQEFSLRVKLPQDAATASSDQIFLRRLLPAVVQPTPVPRFVLFPRERKL